MSNSSRTSRDPRRRTQPASSYQQPHSVVRPEEVDVLLKRIRDFEEQAGTECQVLATVKACVTWMDAKAEQSLRLADELKDKVAR